MGINGHPGKPRNLDVVGTLEIPELSHRPGHINYTGPCTDEIFWKGYLPPLVPYKSAFVVKIKGIDGSAKRIFVAMLTDDEKPVYSLVGDTLRLSFSYRETGLEFGSIEASAFRLDPVISNVYVRDGFIGILLVGDANHCVSWAKRKMFVIEHGDVTYELRSTLVKEDVISGKRMGTGAVVIGSSMELPSENQLKEFTEEFFSILTGGKGT